MSDEIQLFIPVKKEDVVTQNFSDETNTEILVPFTQELIEKIASKFTNFELNNIQVSLNVKVGAGQALKWVVDVEGTGGLVLNFKKL